MYRVTSPLLLFAVLATAPLASWAAPITVPSDLGPGDQYRLVFVTSTERDARSSDIADYNAFVTDVANSVPELAALGTTWSAIASTAAVDARDNTGTNPANGPGVPIYRLDEMVVAVGSSDLWDGGILSAIVLDESGGPVGLVNPIVWTGSASDGTGIPTRFLGDTNAIIGFASFTNSSWIAFSAFPRFDDQMLYAMSGVLTVEVPEPGTMTMILLALSATTVAGRQSRRRG